MKKKTKLLSVFLILLCLGGCSSYEGKNTHLWEEYNETYKNMYCAGYMESKYGNKSVEEGWKWYDNEMRERLGLK